MDYRSQCFLNVLTIIVQVVTVVSGGATFSGNPSNASVLYGETAQFKCTITGTQAMGEDVQFYKTSPAPSTLIGLNSNVRDTNKYNSSGTFTYSIYRVTMEDEGKYECVLYPQTLEAYLSISVAPKSHSISWSKEATHVTLLRPTNLTCTTQSSKPPATHRWFKGTNDITNMAIRINPTTDSNGYGDSVSYMELTLTQADFFAPYQCIADIPGASAVKTAEIRVQFSTGPRMYISRLTVLMFVSIVCNWIFF